MPNPVMISLTGPYTAVASKALTGVDPDPTLHALYVDAGVADICSVEPDVAANRVKITVPKHVLSTAMQTAVEEAEFQIGLAPVFIRVPLASYEQPVPAGTESDPFPHATHVDEADQTVPTKWSQWRDEYHEHFAASNGDMLIPGNSWGVELTFEQGNILIAAGFTLLSPGEFKAALSPTEEA